MLDLAARLALSPVLLAQAVAVRRRALHLPEAAGPRRGKLGSGPTLRLRIIGDSSAAGVGVARQQDALAGQLAAMLSRRHTVCWDLDAATGATTRSTLQRLSHSDQAPADVIVTALGVNDVTRQLPVRLWLRQQRALIDRLRVLYAPRLIYVCGIPPLGHFPLLPDPLRWALARHARKLETALARDLAGSGGALHVPFNLPLAPGLMASDGFHPSARLYTLWAKEMASRITADWPLIQSG
ncbi:GDSL-like Lipase/Acylhydrolase [Sulfitobacter sp. THAF37]|uniref:SGNH/GDSL hydrolase family protein n=1 Tax=Sulfitobacter sp. THAF37 TaxID=2587855 RepID=UPI001267A8E7|nr:SGNH/GDSL hydrolase family protein [Sulfitobacter sp. THAF37]QFT57421.1 GDSL-like Lipase/Acylhydrolase [Sulfitobacter sp. THAF37]